jgi:CO/xanthine dehydrogenase FAD-binding subunit
MSEDIEEDEDLDPRDLEAFYASADPDDEFIVQIEFDYCEVNYSGYEILSRAELGKLIAGLRSGVRVGTRNMPGSWYEDFDIGLLDGSFSIHSANPDDIAAMRSVFGDYVGNTGYFDDVMEAAPKVIDLQLAREFLKGDSIDLSEMTSITDEAAEVLSKHEGWLSLGGLTELSDAAAESLSKHKDTLSVDCLTELSDAAAEALAKHEGVLSLNGLTELSDAAAESLSKVQGDLSLGSLTELSDAAVESLSKAQGSLSLNGLTELSDAAVETLAKHDGGTLSLNGLTELSDAAAESLSKHQEDLYLDGLTELSDAAVESLSKHKGDLSLGGLTELSDAAAEVLAKREGFLSLYRIKRLPLPLASFFASFEEDELWLDLNGLDSLDEEAARLLSAGKFSALCFNGLKEIAPDVISAFAGYNGYLGLGGLTALSEELSAALAQHKGDLGLDDVTELSDAVAEALSNYEGQTLGLYGLETISAQGAKFLLNAKGEVSTHLDLEAIANGDDEEEEDDCDDEYDED